MCGILGHVSFTTTQRNKKNFLKSLELLKSRGPDTQGLYEDTHCTLGHQRLAILDLDTRSNQPMKYKSLLIVFNGEIYNFQTIKKELEEKGRIFNTLSDTEVILQAYDEWGEDCVKKFDGMWAFCIYNTKDESYFLSRDRIGEKPLVYYHTPKEFIFSSEIPSLLTLLDTKNIKPNWNAIANFNLYNFRHIPAPYTAYENIFKLEPGYNLLIKKGKLQKKKYFSILKKQVKEEDTQKELEHSIQQTMISDVPVGIFLSGGVDSSLISSFAHKDIKTYTLGKNKDDIEAIRAGQIAKKLKVPNTQVYFENSVEQQSILEQISHNIAHYGEPVLLNQIIYSNMLLEEMKKEGIKVSIGGNGADELFYGYDGSNTLYLLTKIRSIWKRLGLQRITPKSLKPYLCTSSEDLKIQLYTSSFKKKTYIKKKYRKFLYEKQFKEYAKELPQKDLIRAFQWLGLRIESEHSITIVADVAGSMNGMEIRTIFLNKNMLEHAVNLKNSAKIKSFYNKKHNKYILKKILSGQIGKDLAYDKKRGFGYGITLALAYQDRQKEIQELIETTVPNIPIYSLDKVKEIVRTFFETGKGEEILGEIIAVCLWYKHITNTHYI